MQDGAGCQKRSGQAMGQVQSPKEPEILNLNLAFQTGMKVYLSR